MSSIINEGNKTTVKPVGDVVASNARRLKTELQSLIDHSFREITIDLASVKMVDSIGIGIFCAVHNSLEKLGGKLKIINVNKDIYQALITMRLNHHFTIKKA